MVLISDLFVLPIILIALGTIAVVAPIMGIDAPKHRYASIDGLRGFLAIFVFLHHSSVWCYFSRNRQWNLVSSNLFNHFGPSSVALFFMITSFLFFSKLLDAYGRTFDWLTLYVSRIARILPLYLIAVLILFLIVGFITHFELREPVGDLLLKFGQWLLVMEPNINGVGGTKFIICGVQWSLAYEWLFYCSLALLGRAFFRLKPSWLGIMGAGLFGLVFTLVIYRYYASDVWMRLCPFGSGLAAAIVARKEKARQLLSSRAATLVLILLLIVALFLYENLLSPIPLLCISVLFMGIACGNSLFGLLTWKPCRQLGQISYSIYLLHGFLLFTTFYFVLGFGRTAQLTYVQHWATISVCCVFLIILCCFSYYYVERPGIWSATAITKKIRRLLHSDSPPGSPAPR